MRHGGSTSLRSGFKILDGRRSELISLGPSQTGGTYLVWRPLGRGPREHSRRWAPRLTRSTVTSRQTCGQVAEELASEGRAFRAFLGIYQLVICKSFCSYRVWSCSRLPTSFDVMLPSPSRLRFLRTQRATRRRSDHIQLGGRDGQPSKFGLGRTADACIELDYSPPPSISGAQLEGTTRWPRLQALPASGLPRAFSFGLTPRARYRFP